ncbi:zinc finger protein 395 [Rhineura floridana]|uniref:zinc finger protein 395 n=1 Tax=Rhineura floridana TaxID=261503 RepID=UPI002AC8546B|nr:zinc finger protein 395 [Rhineura floridana]
MAVSPAGCLRARLPAGGGRGRPPVNPDRPPSPRSVARACCAAAAWLSAPWRRLLCASPFRAGNPGRGLPAAAYVRQPVPGTAEGRGLEERAEGASERRSWKGNFKTSVGREGASGQAELASVSKMASVLSRRLGKRSLLGARISAPQLLGDGVLMTAPPPPPLQPEYSKGSPQLASYEEGHFKEQAEDSGSRNQNWPALQPGQKVYVTYNGQENAGLVEHHDLVNNEVKVLLLEQGFYICRKAEEVRLANIRGSPLPALEMDCGTPTTMDYSTVPATMEHCPTAVVAVAAAPGPRSVSRNIDVPKRKSDAAVEMDEMMAAMVLTSLSCSPVVQSPPNGDASIPGSAIHPDPCLPTHLHQYQLGCCNNLYPHPFAGESGFLVSAKVGVLSSTEGRLWGLVRSRSLSFGEQQLPPPPPPLPAPVLKSHLIVTSPPRAPSGTRKVRGEAKKCRKVYGIEHRDQWCTACRWKKACQRFLD